MMKYSACFLIIAMSLLSSVMGSVTNVDSLRALRTVRGKNVQADATIRGKNVVLQDTNKAPALSVVIVADTMFNRSGANTDRAIATAYEAFSWIPPSTVSANIVSLPLKRSGSITGNGTLCTLYVYSDNAGVPGSKLSGQNAYPALNTATTATSYGYTYYFKFISSSGISFTGGTVYWFVMKNSTLPSGANLVINVKDTGTARYATSTDGSTWTPVNTVTPGVSVLYYYPATAGGVYTSAPGQAFVGISYTSDCLYGTASGLLDAGVLGYNLRGGYGVRGSSPFLNGIGGYFSGGTGLGHGIVVTKGALTDSLIVADSVARPAPVTGTVATTKYFGVDGDTVMTTPKIWMGITVKGIKYKVPLY